MRKSVFILLAIVLCFVLIVSCNDSPAGGGSESAPTDNMTESYRNARKVFHDSTSIWLPELEGVEVADADIEITKTDYKPLINLSFTGNEELFNQLVALFTSVIGNPDSNMSTETFKFWEAEYSDGGQLYMGNTSVSLLGENKDKIAMHGHFFRAFTVTLNANPAAGGTVKINQAGTNYDTTITSTEGSDIDLVATAADGYEFAGWYLGDTKLSDKANYMDYEVPSSSVAIEGRFSQPEMTESFTAGRNAIHDVTGIWLLPLSDATGYSEKIGTTALFDIQTNEESYDAMLADLISKIGDPDFDGADNKRWELERTVGDVTFGGHLNFGYNQDDSLIIIDCAMSPMTESYAEAKGLFKQMIGITIPGFSGLEVDYSMGETSFCFDITGGDNLDWETCQSFYDYYVGLYGNCNDGYPQGNGDNENFDAEWTLENGAWLQCLWDSDNSSIYINASNASTDFIVYDAAKTYCSNNFEIILPDSSASVLYFSVSADGTEITLGLSSDSFTEEIYNQFKSSMIATLGDGTDNTDPGNNMRMDWTVGGLLYSLEWDLTTGLSIDISET